MKPESNYFLVNRSLLNSDRWLSESFTRGQAWVDMFGLAQHTSSYFRVRGIKMEIQRGQLAYSEVSLSKRWKWSRNKVRRFLKELEKNGDIEQQKNNVTTVITIKKYDIWQGTEHQTEQQKDTKRNNRKTPKGTHTNKDKKEKKVKKDKVSSKELTKQSFGNPDINQIITLLKETFKLPKLDGSEKVNRRYANLLIKKAEGNLEGVLGLIKIAAQDDWYKNNITSTKDLYYNAMKIMARKRGKQSDRPIFDLRKKK